MQKDLNMRTTGMPIVEVPLLLAEPSEIMLYAHLASEKRAVTFGGGGEWRTHKHYISPRKMAVVEAGQYFE